jgi:hypothetical protein
VLGRITQAMQDTLRTAHFDERIPKLLLSQMRDAWNFGLAEYRI